MAKTAKPKGKSRAKGSAKRAQPKVKAKPRMAAKKAARAAKPRRPAARAAGSGRFTLYGHFNSMPAAKVMLMLTLAGAPFSYRHVNLAEGAQRQPDYLALNRYGQVPVLRHGDVTLAQSNVILRYLAPTLGKFDGANEAERREIAQWLDWEADGMSSGVRALRAAVRFLKAEPAVLQYVRGRAERAMTALNAALADRAFLVGGRPTIADIAVLPHLTVADEGGLDVAAYPHVRAWMDRMLALPGAAHPYDLTPKQDRD